MAQSQIFLKVAIPESMRKALDVAEARTGAESVSAVVRAAIDAYCSQVALEHTLQHVIADQRETTEAGIEALATKGAELLNAMRAEHTKFYETADAAMAVMKQQITAAITDATKRH